MKRKHYLTKYNIFYKHVRIYIFNIIIKNIMDVIILAAGLGSRVSKYTNNLIPKFLINIDHNTGLYYIIKYWSKYSDNIHLVINSKYNIITNFYLKNVIPDISKNVKIINYDTNDGTAYTINYLLVNKIIEIKNKNLLLTWCDIFPDKKINFKYLYENTSHSTNSQSTNTQSTNTKNIIDKNKIKRGNKIITKKLKTKLKNNITIFVHGNSCRYILNDANEIINCNNGGNIVGIYYFENFEIFDLEKYGKPVLNEDIVIFLKDISPHINSYLLENIIDYGDEEKFENITIHNDKIFKCRYFNNIKIVDDNKLFKCGIDEKGKELINIEMNWYKYILNNNNQNNDNQNNDNQNNDNQNNDFKNYIPIIYEMYDYGFLMEYKKNYVPLYEYLKNLDSSNKDLEYENISKIKTNILESILDKINKLHTINTIKEDKNVFMNNLKMEIYDKIINRKKVIDDLLSYFDPIEYVNGVKIDSLENILLKCKNIITQYYNTLDNYEYSVIMGDCQFSNILINGDNNNLQNNKPESKNDIIFIDPRGYFGGSKIFGPKDYDYAKILYAIYGYDDFNNNNKFIVSFEGENNNKINIPIKSIDFDKNVLQKHFNKLHKAYVITIWLSLAEYNKNHIWKCLSSYYYGLYLGSTIL